MFVQPRGEPRGGRRAGLEWVDSSWDRGRRGYAGESGPQASAGPALGAAGASTGPAGPALGAAGASTGPGSGVAGRL